MISDADVDLISDYYLASFSAPIFKAANVDMLKKYIRVANKLITAMTGLALDVASYTKTIENTELTSMFDLDFSPVASLTSIAIDGDDPLDIVDTYKYKLHPKSVVFYTQIGIGTVVIIYTAGEVLDDTLKTAHCLEVNHLVNSKMIDNERIGSMSITPDRSSVPKEVLVMVGSHDSGVEI